MVSKFHEIEDPSIHTQNRHYSRLFLTVHSNGRAAEVVVARVTVASEADVVVAAAGAAAAIPVASRGAAATKTAHEIVEATQLAPP